MPVCTNFAVTKPHSASPMTPMIRPSPPKNEPHPDCWTEEIQIR